MNVAALRDSFAQAVDANPHLVHDFYEGLFRRRPDLRAYFPHDMKAQEAALEAKLQEILLHLEDLEYLQQQLPALGARHAEMYRVTPDMFEPVTAELIITLENSVGGWGDQREALRQEWTAALTAVVHLMLSGFPGQQEPGPSGAS